MRHLWNKAEDQAEDESNYREDTFIADRYCWGSLSSQKNWQQLNDKYVMLENEALKTLSDNIN